MALALLLDFEPTERPVTRRADLTTSEMLAEIGTMSERFHALPGHTGSYADSQLWRTMAVHCVWLSGRHEGNGIRNDPDGERTRALLVDGLGDNLVDRERRECVQLHNAVGFAASKMDTPHEEAVQRLHTVLTKGIADHPGSYRRTASFVFDAADHHVCFFEPWEQIPSLMGALVEQHAMLAASADDAPTTPYKLAAVFVLELLRIRPFVTHNEVLARVLLTQLLRSQVPVPVAVDAGLVPYVDALHIFPGVEALRSHLENFTALLVESVWSGWRTLTQIVDQIGLHRPRQSRGVVFANHFHRRTYNRLHRIGLGTREADEEFAQLDLQIREWRRRCNRDAARAAESHPGKKHHVFNTELDLFYNSSCAAVYWITV